MTPIGNFAQVIEKSRTGGKRTIAVAVAQDRDVLQAVKMAEELGLCSAILVGDEARIRPEAEKLGLMSAEIVHEADERQAAAKAVELVRSGRADMLMKGLLNSTDFLRAVLEGGGKGRLLSHLAALEMPGGQKLLFITDGGMNIAPDLGQKKAILLNALEALGRLGFDNPKVAVLSANEKVHPKIQSTVDAQALVEMRRTGEIPTGVIEGPMALDVAVSPAAARHKGISSEVSGDADLFLVPTLDVGNILGKALLYYGGAKMAGLVVGTGYPIVLTSRAETAAGKLCSIALAGLMAHGRDS